MIYLKNAYTSKGSFNRSYNKAFDAISDETEERQKVYIPKKGDGQTGELILEIDNIAELQTYFIKCSDIGVKKGYYTLDLPILTKCPSGEYNYRLKGADNSILAEGILQIIGREKKSSEYHREIEYKEYGRK